MSGMNATAAYDFKQQLTEGCHAKIEGYGTSYGYVPSLAAGIVFCTLFGLSMILHMVQLVWKRTWWCAVFVLGCMVEVLGWAGRTWSAECPYNGTAFLMQISTLIIAPTFFTAGIYILLGRFIHLLGPETSILSPKLYLWIFVTCDVVSLVVQAVGGGMASIEVNKVNGNTAPGTHTMVAGIVFQLASITVFVFLAADFIRRTLRQQLLQTMTGTIVPLLGAMIFSVVCIYIRSIYRTIELSQGWTGFLITHERYFIVLDGVMMVLAVGIFNIFHPGWLLPKHGPKAFHREIYSPDGLASGMEMR
ncbi:RTA1-domain-containing protein [Aspergillus sclerotioniger CBS 115572]|uniref:RTA1-domain-containing protein n=1 Tax=Aspergillus sclerotioniger CBS 115572 TaxID=1450535 RepID=A0A317WH87_9EURO|nr:RTA1-domain-containing protein [Aspergillus sclerotioniger CBS 115572]PWY84597.1 RTA1-domain-containing protein [Aspergillus sclerotioniger CBS 115572]